MATGQTKADEKSELEMGVFIFVYEYPRTGGCHCCECRDSSNGFADHDRLAAPGRRQEDKPCCKVEEC